MPGALQGRLPCFVNVSQGSLNFIVATNLIEKKKNKKNNSNS